MKKTEIPQYTQPSRKDGQTSGKAIRARVSAKGAGRPEVAPKKMGI